MLNGSHPNLGAVSFFQDYVTGHWGRLVGKSGQSNLGKIQKTEQQIDKPY